MSIQSRSGHLLKNSGYQGKASGLSCPARLRDEYKMLLGEDVARDNREKVRQRKPVDWQRLTAVNRQTPPKNETPAYLEWTAGMAVQE